MKVLVTGSAGHLSEALIRSLLASGDQPVGIDVQASEFTDCVGNIADRAVVQSCVRKTSRFFPEAADKKDKRDAYEDANL